MIEPVRTFYGRTKGLHRERETVVVQQTWWRCTECNKYFQRKEEADRHARREHMDKK